MHTATDAITEKSKSHIHCILNTLGHNCHFGLIIMFDFFDNYQAPHGQNANAVEKMNLSPRFKHFDSRLNLLIHLS